MLDPDTREYLMLLVTGAGQGLEGRGKDLREVFRLFEPTHRDLARVNRRVADAARQPAPPRHLAQPAQHRARRQGGRAGGARGLRLDGVPRVRVEDRNICRAVRELPEALARRPTRWERSSGSRRCSAPRPSGCARRSGAGPQPGRAAAAVGRGRAAAAREIRPFVRDARPIVRDLRPAARDLSASTPNLTRSFVVLNRLFNMASYNTKRRERPEARPRRGLPLLPGLAAAQLGDLFATADAHGPFRPPFVAATARRSGRWPPTGPSPSSRST